MSDETQQKVKKLSVWQIISSVLAAAIGVQSNKNRERDFTRAKPTTYIIAGAIFTLLFILTLVILVNIILKSSA